MSELAAGGRGLVARLKGGQDLVTRMSALGFTTGAEVTVVQNYGRGPLIVRVRDTQVALGRGEALKVIVTDASNATASRERQSR